MVAYAVKSRWLQSEASSGTAPTSTADDEGTSDLDMDYGTSDANWTSNADGNGIDFLNTTGSAVAEKADLSAASSIGGELDGATEVSIIFVARIDASDNNMHRAFFIGSSSGNGELTLVIGTSTMELRWAQESGASTHRAEYAFIPSGSEDIFQFVIDTGEAAADDRCKLTLNGSFEAVNSATTITEDEAINTQDVNFSMCIGNRPSANRMVNMASWYLEMGTGLLTSQQLTDSRTALLLDNDADWQAAADEDVDALMLVGAL